MDEKICQSCGLPMSEKDDTVGTNFDGTMSTEYCSYCYELGEFTIDCSLEEMVDLCAPAIANEETGLNEEEAREFVKNYLPTLRRWKKNEIPELYDNPLDRINEERSE